MSPRYRSASHELRGPGRVLLVGLLLAFPAAAQTTAPAPQGPAAPPAAPAPAASAAPAPAVPTPAVPASAASEPEAAPSASGDPSWQVDDPAPPAEQPAAPPDEPADEPGDEAVAPQGSGEPKQLAPKRYPLPSSSEEPLPPTDYDEVPYTRHQLRWDVQLGVRTSWIRTAALDPFAENDALTQASLSFGRGLFREGPWSLAALAVWETGGTSASARGTDASFSAQRFALAVEGRYQLLHWVYGYGRLAPGALRTVARVDSSSGQFEYEARTWVVGADAALGAAVRPFGDPDGRNPGVRFWVFLEGGYGWSATQDLTLRAGSGAPERTEPLEFKELSLAGGYGRLGATLAF